MVEWGQNPTARTLRSLKNDPPDADPEGEFGGVPSFSEPRLPFHVHAKSPLSSDLQAPASR
jgi:hypothetical protein